MSETVYDFTCADATGKPVDLGDYRGKVLLIVNTASKCGFTPQFAGLEALYEDLSAQDFAILGFPCNQFGGQDPGSNDEIVEFCQLNYGVSFPMFGNKVGKWLQESASNIKQICSGGMAAWTWPARAAW